MEFDLFDSHSHLQDSAFDKDREEVIEKMKEKKMGAINIGSDLSSSMRSVELAEKYDNLFAVVGSHPENIEEDFEEEKYISLLKNKKVVGIGECGLDFYQLEDKSLKDRQKEIFSQQINLAKRYNKPLVLHIRSDENWDAHRDAIEILKGFGEIRAVCHFFTANWEIAQEFLNLGFYISFSGVITFANQYDEVVAKTPLDKILAETDCPYVAPVPFRGKRNEPIFVEYTIRRIAEIRGLSFEEVAKSTAENTIKLFNL